MKQKDQLTIRMLRSLVFLALTMLAPIGAWAEDYNLWVAGVQVTDANAANVLNEVNNNEPTVVFGALTNTLTLNGASVGQITYSGTSNLTIAFSGTCSITTEETSAIQYTGSESDRVVLVGV